MDDALVSVITLAYNSMETIFATIDSILMQSYKKIQIIIADDYSKDFNKQKIVEYIEKNKKGNIKEYCIYRNSENLGIVKNMNCAVKAANGEIIINLSADDLFYDKNVITAIVDEFKQSGCNILCTARAAFYDDPDNIVRFMPNSYERKRINKFKNSMQEYIAMYTGRYFDMASGSSLSYRKEYWEKLNFFDEQYRLLEDTPFFAKSILYDGMLHFNYNIISILYRLGGVSTGVISKVLKDDILKFLDIGLQDKRIKGISKRWIKYRKFIMLSTKSKSKRRFISIFKFPDIIFLSLLDKIRYYIYIKINREDK